MSYLLTTEDERELTRYLCEELGAQLLLSDVAPGSKPRIARDPLAALPAELPGPPVMGGKDIYQLLFWLAACGPIETMSDVQEATDDRDRVARYLTRQSAGDEFADVIDMERTPVLCFRRTIRSTINRLAPGTLNSMAVKSSAIPGDVKSNYAKANRWLKKSGIKTDPFCHCPEVRHRRPKHPGPLWVWVHPHAMQLVDQGTEIWPWNA